MFLLIPFLVALYLGLAGSAFVAASTVPADADPVVAIHYLAHGVLTVNRQTLATRFVAYGQGIEDRRRGREQ